MGDINKIYIASFLYGFTSLASVVFTLYFLANSLSQTQIALLFTIFMISLAFLEIPTGAISDIFGHRISISLGVIIESLYFLIFFFSRSFEIFLIGMLVAALGIALQSGAINALIYEIMKKNSKEDLYEKVIGRRNTFIIAGGLIAAPIGSIIFRQNNSLPYLLAFLVLFMSCFFYFSVKHNPKSSQFSPAKYMNQIKSGFLLMVKSRKLVGLTIIGFSLTMGRLVFNQNINQPYLIDIGVPLQFIGFVAAFGALISLLISSKAYIISKYLGERKSLIFMFGLPFISFVLMGMVSSLGAILFIVLYYIAVAYREPAMISITQKEIDDKHRATMSSTGSFLSSVVVGSVLPVWGLTIDNSSLSFVLVILGISVLLIGISGLIISQSKG